MCCRLWNGNGAETWCFLCHANCMILSFNDEVSSIIYVRTSPLNLTRHSNFSHKFSFYDIPDDYSVILGKSKRHTMSTWVSCSMFMRLQLFPVKSSVFDSFDLANNLLLVKVSSCDNQKSFTTPTSFTQCVIQFSKLLTLCFSSPSSWNIQLRLNEIFLNQSMSLTQFVTKHVNRLRAVIWNN